MRHHIDILVYKRHQNRNGEDGDDDLGIGAPHQLFSKQHDVQVHAEQAENGSRSADMHILQRFDEICADIANHSCSDINDEKLEFPEHSFQPGGKQKDRHRIKEQVAETGVNKDWRHKPPPFSVRYSPVKANQ